MYRRIRDLREDSDLFQKDLAEYLQCSQVCYSHYEMGKRDIPTTPAPIIFWGLQTRKRLTPRPRAGKRAEYARTVL